MAVFVEASASSALAHADALFQATEWTTNNEKGIAAMKLTTTTLVSVDGVMQGIGAPDEDRSGGIRQ